MLTTLLLYLLLGAFAGVIAGLFGVGGGVIIVPALVYALSAQGIEVDVLTHMSVATSLAVISTTSLSSVLAHHRNGFVQWKILQSLLPGLIIGVIAGVFLAVQIPGQTLQLVMGLFLIFVGVQMAFKLVPSHADRTLPGPAGLFSAASFTGVVSALFGIGGGTVTVPFLSFFGVRMQHAVATSAACGFPIALFGAISNVLAGWDNSQLPDYTWGYVYWPAFVGIALASAPFAKLGAQLAKNMSAIKLKRIFAIFLAMMGSSMIIKALGFI